MDSSAELIACSRPEEGIATVTLNRAGKWDLGVPCNVLDQGVCKQSFLELVLPQSRTVG